MKIYLLFVLFIISLFIHSEENNSENVDLENILGSTPEGIIDTLGSPKFFIPIRGEEESDDDVLLFYENNLYVYMNESRVWQVRVDRSYLGFFVGLEIGLTREGVIEILGTPFKDEIEYLIYKRPDRGYPVFLRTYFVDNKVDDIYIYRGDY